MRILIVIWLCLLFGPFAVVWSLVEGQKYQQFTQNGVLETATIAAARHIPNKGRGQGRMQLLLNVEVDGVSYLSKVYMPPAEYWNLDQRQTLDVFYSPEDPGNVRQPGKEFEFRVIQGFGLFLAIAGAIALRARSGGSIDG